MKKKVVALTALSVLLSGGDAPGVRDSGKPERAR